MTDTDGEAVVALYCSYTRGTRRLRSLSNFYTTEYMPVSLAKTVDSERAWDLLADFIACERPAWTSVEFRMLRQENASCHPFFSRLADAGFHIYQYPLYENWFTSIKDTSFENYFQNLTSRLRNTIRRKSKKLQRQDSVRIKTFSTPRDNIAKAIRDYVDVYNSSWKKPEPYENFIPKLVESCANSGTLLLGILYLGKRPVAAQLWIITKAKALIYKLAYVEDQSEFSPGSILSKALFEIAIDDYKPLEIDYGIGNETYKADWMDERRFIYVLHGYNKRNIVGLTYTVLHKIKTLLKKVL